MAPAPSWCREARLARTRSDMDAAAFYGRCAAARAGPATSRDVGMAPGIMSLPRVLLPLLLLCATWATAGAQYPLLGSFAAPSLPPVGTVTNGTCGHTDWSVACNTASSGAFDARKEGIKDLAGCVARVNQCKQGAFASFSADHNDCSWYSACDDWPRLEDAALYQTERVRGSPPPPGSTPSPPVSVKIDWTKEMRRTSTAATVEVDVMPF